MRLSTLTILMCLCLSCANVMAPTGGPKDETPPKLLSSIPKQDQTNYKGSAIMLEFDEFLKLKSPQDEIIITPTIKEVKYSAKKSIFSIELGEKLLENTTYSIAFRESIQDLNEGNPAEDLRLAFSTGPEIDSLKIRGTVTQLLRGEPADKITVALYQADTFDIFKHKPSYFTRSNKKGKFAIQNLKAGEYGIYCFEDKNKNLILDSKSEKFGFAVNKVASTNISDSVSLNVINLDARPIAISGIRSLGHFTKIRLNKNLTNYRVKSLDDSIKILRNCFSTSQSEIDIFPSKPPGDSTLINLTGIDSLEQKIDTAFYVKQTNAKSLKEKIKIKAGKIQFIEDTQKFTAELSTSELLKSILTDSIYISEDTIRRIPFQLSNINFDTIFRKISINKTFDRKDSINWKKSKFVLGGMAFTSINGDSSVTAISAIPVIKAEESASLIVDIETVQQNIFFEILDDRFQPIDKYPYSKVIVIKNIKPGNVLMRRVHDSNNNGRWDAGNPNLKIPPETVVYYVNPDSKREIPLRANWEVNIKWNF